MKAIRWAVEHDAQVINMSLGGFRDPRDPDRDAFSPLEAAAVGWAHGKGVVVVAAVGNSDRRRRRSRGRTRATRRRCRTCSASARSRGTAPSPSSRNRDKIYNDIAAPGVGIVSTFPLALTAEYKECLGAGLLELRARRLPQGRGDVVRRAAGERRRGGPARGQARTCGPSR